MPRKPSAKPAPKKAPKKPLPKLPARRAAAKPTTATPYRHEADTALRPEVGTQAQFKQRKPPTTYRFDSSLAPELVWDDSSTRAVGEWVLQVIEELVMLSEAKHLHAGPGDSSRDPSTSSGRAQSDSKIYEFKNARGEVLHTLRTLPEALALLKRLSRPFLNWAGKAERLSFDVPTLPLFIHERLSTAAILQTLKGHKRDKQMAMFDLFGDPQRSLADQLLRAYEHVNNWSNRLILGDSLVVMNSLLRYEGLGGQVQMIYMDPPYGVKFGSNFQPFVRKRDVSQSDDEDMTREPEMVKAYRDTWELGLHSYLTYMRDRLLIARDLLTPSGSIFVQISDENVHHVRELMDEVFGAENFVSIITFAKTTQFSGKTLSSVADYILWYAKDKNLVKYRQLYRFKEAGDEGASKYRPVKTFTSIPDGRFNADRLATSDQLTSQGSTQSEQSFEFENKTWNPPMGMHWKTTVEGLNRLAQLGRVVVEGNSIRFIRFLDDFPVFPLSNIWTDVGGIQDRTEGKLYVVQTANLAILRCMMMTTDPGDLVFDPTCGSGTTAYVAENWGRRWITCDVSRVPLALARQRLLTATFPFYQLKDEARGPAGGFVYQRKQNNKGEEVGGIVPHITLKSIAQNEPAAEEVLVDRPDENNKITRITGPFTFEATIPTPTEWEDSPLPAGEGPGVRESGESHATFTERMLAVLRQSPILHIGGGQTVTLKNIRPPAKTLALSAEALVDASAAGQRPTLMDVIDEAEEKSGKRLPLSQKAVAIVFGPENAAVSEKLVYQAGKEANAKNYSHLYVIGFAIQPNARALIEEAESTLGLPATYVQATPDLMMGDLLKNMRSSQIFSVCGLPEIKVTSAKDKESGERQHRVELLGLDVFDPTTMEVLHRRGDDVPCWMLDSDYNGLCFRATQVFFPRTLAWDALKKALKGTYEDSIWEHLAGTVSEPFGGGEHGQVAVKVIDDRGNELLVVKAFA